MDITGTVSRNNIKGYLLLTALLVIFLYLTRSGVLPAIGVQWLTDVSWTVFSALAALACYVHAQKHAGKLRQAWLFLSYAHVSWFIGILIWSYLELFARQATPFPAWSDLGFMLFAPLFLIAIYHFRTREDTRFKYFIFAKVLMIIVIISITHVFLFHERLFHSGGSFLYNVAAVVYPVLYMTAMIYGLLSFKYLNINVSLKIFTLIILGLFTHAVTVSLYAYSLLGREYQVGSYLDVFWLLAFGLVFLSVTQAKYSASRGETLPRILFTEFIRTTIIPGLLAVLVVVLLLHDHGSHQENSDFYIYVFSILLITILLYQVAVSRLEGILVKNLATSEVLLEKTHTELMQLATESSEKLGQEIEKSKQADSELKKYHFLLHTIKTVQDEYISGIGRHEFFERLLRTILDLTGSEYGFIGEVLFKGGKPYLKTYAMSNSAWDDATRKFYDENIAKGLVFDSLDTLFGHTLTTAETVISNEPAYDERSSDLPGEHLQLNSYLGIPLMANDRLIGMLAVANRKDGYQLKDVDYWQPFFRTCGSLVLANKVDNDRKQAEERLIEAKNEAEIANSAKSEFISRMSHELRTPLNAVIGFAQILEMDETLTADQKDSISEIHVAGSHLLELISDLLDVSRIEAGKMKFNFEAIIVPDIIQASILFVDKLAREKGVTISYPENCGCRVNGDVVRLKQVFINLLSNAIKYNKDGGRIDITSNLDETGNCIISISDTGIGIAASEMNKLFTPFERLGAEDRSIDGVGIGLYITRQIIDAHSGNITVKSQPEEGSTFIVQIPATLE